MKKRLFIFFLSLLFLCSCASLNITSFNGINNTLEDDEARLWKRSDEFAERIDSGDFVYEDAVLEEYVNSILNKIIPENIKNTKLKLEVKVIKDPLFNAFAAPDGRIYIHTGILARMDNEAQLATLLGHEINHAINRHGLKQFRGIKNKSAFYNTLAVTSAGVGGSYGTLFNIFLRAGVLGAAYGYSREHEREADENGFNLMYKTGYDVKEAPKLFKHLQENFDKEIRKEPFFFGTHPRLKERIKNFEELIKETDAAEIPNLVKNEENFIKHTNLLVLDNAIMDLSRGYFETAKAGLNKFIKNNPKDVRGYYYLAEVYKNKYEQPENKRLKDKESKEDCKKEAIEYYKKAISIDKNHAESYRDLGMVYYKDNDPQKAKEYLAQYLKINPQAKDKNYIENYLRQIDK